MAREQYRNFMDYMWIQKEDNIFSIGINEDGLERIESILSIDLPPEGEIVEADAIIGTIETQDGPLDIISPVSGTITEINTSVLEDSTLIQDDPYDSWLVKIESEDDLADDEEEEDEEEDDEEDDDELDQEEEED